MRSTIQALIQWYRKFWIARTYSGQAVGKSFMGELALGHQRFVAMIMRVLEHSKYRDPKSTGLLSQDVLAKDCNLV